MNYQLFYVFLSILGHYAAAITYEYMDELCSQDIDLGIYDSVRLKLTSSSWYKTKMDCHIRVKTDSLSKIMLYFKSFNVDSTLSCTNDWLEVRDGQYSTSSYVSGVYGKQCGSYMSSTVRKTSGNYLYLRFVSDSYQMYNNGFDMVLTSFHTGLCYSYEYSCDNGRCVSDSLTCNGYNPCGDYSDCSVNIVAGGAIAGIAVGPIIFVTIVTAVIVIVCRRRRLAYVGTPLHQPVIAVTTTTGYDQPVPKQYSPQSLPQPKQAYPAGQYPQY